MLYHFVILSLILLIKCELEPFIVKGELGKIREFPHAAFLTIKCHGEGQPGWICGSSIVNQKIMLTAAHCVIGCFGQSTMFVSVGNRHRNKGFISRVRSVHAHEEYRTNSFAYDIALMGLRTKLIFGTDVRRVALMKNPPRFVKAQVAGWGYIKEEPAKKKHIIHYMDQYVWTWAKCRKLNKKIPAGTLCGKSKNSSYATGGDSGSALVVRGYIQIGIVSYKMPHISKSLVVYTDTGYFYDWIRKNSKKLYCVIEQV